MQASYKETNTKPNQSQQNQIKRNEHTIAQSKQLRDQSKQTCNPQCPLPVNMIMLKKINKKWSKIVKRIGNKKITMTIPNRSPLKPSFQLPFSSSLQKVSTQLLSGSLFYSKSHKSSTPQRIRILSSLNVSYLISLPWPYSLPQ